MADGPEPGRNLVLFDSQCVLCDHTMRRLYRWDRQHRLWYASLDGSLAESIRQRIPEFPRRTTSVVLIEHLNEPQERVWYRSEAVLRITRLLPWPWSLLAAASLIPVRWRDTVYLWVAAHRYRWFGQKDACVLPDPAMRERYLG